MLDNYLVVDKSVLPDIFEKVIQVKEMMEQGKYTQVSEAVKEVGISRSAYYKYKNHVFVVSKSNLERKAVISFVLSHEKGILAEVLHVLMEQRCNVLTINQNIPIHNKASVNISIDVSEMLLSMDALLESIGDVKGVSKTLLVSVE